MTSDESAKPQQTDDEDIPGEGDPIISLPAS